MIKIFNTDDLYGLVPANVYIPQEALDEFFKSLYCEESSDYMMDYHDVCRFVELVEKGKRMWTV